MTEFGEVRTAFEYIQDIVPQNHTRKDAKPNTTSSSSTSAKQKAKHPPASKAKQGLKTSGDNENIVAKNTPSGITAQREEEEKQHRRAEIRAQVEGFLEDLNQSELQFPSSFNSHDRLLVHQIAEELGLVHESKGEGRERCITVSRPQEPAQEEEPNQEAEEAQKEENLNPNPQREVACEPQLDLKTLHLERMKREQQKREENTQQKKQQSKILPAQDQSSKKSKSSKGFLWKHL